MSEREHRARIVAIETTGRQGSVLVAVDDEVVGMTRFSADLQHATELLPSIDRLCRSVNWRPDQLDEVYVSAGPGSFTGCRIGVTVARSLALAVGVRLIRVPTVDVLARNALRHEPPPERLVVVLDAQRREIYSTEFLLVNGRYSRETETVRGLPREILACRPRPCAALGEGVAFHRGEIEELGLTILPEKLWPARAENVLVVGRERARREEYTPAERLAPIYIRLPEAEEKWRQRQGGTDPQASAG